jgi:hypothetical protein
MPSTPTSPIAAALQRTLASLPEDSAKDTPSQADVRLLAEFVDGAVEVFPTIRKIIDPYVALVEAPGPDV